MRSLPTLKIINENFHYKLYKIAALPHKGAPHNDFTFRHCEENALALDEAISQA
jgi:hypothetical protein